MAKKTKPFNLMTFEHYARALQAKGLDPHVEYASEMLEAAKEIRRLRKIATAYEVENTLEATTERRMIESLTVRGVAVTLLGSHWGPAPEKDGDGNRKDGREFFYRVRLSAIDRSHYPAEPIVIQSHSYAAACKAGFDQIFRGR